ncbi:MAG TPA: four helix bundle protein [Gemmatimonadaceae bacterium]
MGDYKQLEVWQLAHHLACRIHGATQAMPTGFAELRDQLRRASLSIPTNLAEGSGRWKDADFARYVNIAIGSAAEVESLLLFAGEAEAIGAPLGQELLGDAIRVRQMLARLRAALQKRK